MVAMRRCQAGLAVLAVLSALAACGGLGHRAPSGPGARPPASQGLTWIVAASALVRLRSVPGAASLVQTAFDGPQTYVIVGKRPPAFLAAWRSRRAVSVASYGALQADLGGAGLGRRVRVVVYDQEAWPFTPAAEQRDPAAYLRRAAALVHARGLQLIATPATDLVRVRDPHAGAVYPAFLRLGIAGGAARYADVYEIQAQGAEADVAAYRAFVEQAAAQARRANPRIIVLAGLSTNPSGRRVAASVLYQDVLATRTAVAGFWLNVPSGGAQCPRCGAPQPQVGVALLRLLYGGS